MVTNEIDFFFFFKNNCYLQTVKIVNLKAIRTKEKINSAGLYQQLRLFETTYNASNKEIKYESHEKIN